MPVRRPTTFPTFSTPAKQGHANPTDVADAPEDFHALRLSLARQMMDFTQAWRACRRASCRRARRCVDAGARCIKDMCPPERDPRKIELVRAQMQRAIKRRLAELEGRAGC